MTNPDNIVRVRARNGGRASVYEANGWAQSYSAGLLEGNGVTQNTSADMNVLVGGSTSKPDVVLAENPAGYKIALDLVGQQPVAITTPASNSRISAIVAYTDDLSLQSTEDTVTGSPASCGLIVVNGTASASPSAPTDTQIRSAITADGATGSQACYAIIATIEVASDTTIISDSLITMNKAALSSSNIDFTTLLPNEIAFELRDAQNTGYADNQSEQWYGYNFSSDKGTVSGVCEIYRGSFAALGIGGGVKLTSNAPKGLYLVATEINLLTEGNVDGYRPFRICKGTERLTGDIGVPFRGGSGSATVLVELGPDDILDYQVFDYRTGRTINARIWLRGYFLRPID